MAYTRTLCHTFADSCNARQMLNWCYKEINTIVEIFKSIVKERIANLLHRHTHQTTD
jgi:hypothetical protein